MSSYNHLIQRVEVHYSPSETGGGSRFGMQRMPIPEDSRFNPPPSDTEQHLKRAYHLVAQIRQAIDSKR